MMIVLKKIMICQIKITLWPKKKKNIFLPKKYILAIFFTIFSLIGYMNCWLSNFFYPLLPKEQLWGKKMYFLNKKIKFLLFLIKKLICLYISLVLKINTLYEKWKKNIFDAFKWKPKKIHSRKSIFFYVDWSFCNKKSHRQIFSCHSNYFFTRFP